MIIKILIAIIIVIPSIKGQNTNQEFRSTWVITWDHSNANDTPNSAKTRIRTILGRHAAANMNAIIFQVRQGGNAYYYSSYEPWGYYVGYASPGFDPLTYVIQEAHKRGIEVHAWFNVFQCSSTYPGSPAIVHPDWVCRDGNDVPMSSYRSLSPGLKAVRDYTINVAMEIVNNYDIDGLHLDYVRWTEHTNTGTREAVDHETELRQVDGFPSEEQIRLLNSQQTERYLYDIEHPYSSGVPAGFTSWEKWWRWSVTEFVHDLHDSIQNVRPHVRLSAAVLGKYNWSGWQAYDSVYQDAALWFNEGHIDQLMPMHYHWTTAAGFYGMLTGDCPNCWEDYIQPGIDAGRLYSVGPGSYILDENAAWGNHSDIVNTVRLIPWVDGFQFFAYSSWQNHSYWSTAGNSFFGNKTKIRPIPGNIVTAPSPPLLLITKLDTFTYELTVAPSDTTIDHWFALYQAEGISPDSSDSPIADLHFGRLPFTITDTFTGEQDYNGCYYYAVSQIDRYWNESALSNIVITDTIPSTAPPSPISNLVVTNLGSGIIQLDFDGSGTATEFLVISSSAGYQSLDTVGTYLEKPVTIPGLILNEMHYLQVKGINQFGISDLSERVVVIPTNNKSNILIVNDFRQIEVGSDRDYFEQHGQAFQSLGYPFDSATDDAVASRKINLSDYTMVDWILGESGLDSGTLDISEQAAIANYLEDGGYLFISGTEIGWDLVDKGTAIDREFYTSYLKADYTKDNAGGYQNQHTCKGTLQGMFIGKNDLRFDDGTHGIYDVSSPDGIQSNGGSVLCLEYTGVDVSYNGGAGIQFKGKFATSDYAGGLVYFSVPLETFYPAETRKTLLSSIVDYFGIEQDQQVSSARIEISSIYPNPAYLMTLNIRISSAQEISGQLDWMIYNILGRQVFSDKIKPIYDTEFEWAINLRGWNNKKLPSGVYFIKIDANGKSAYSKFTYLK